jgi:pimeloyl-ACP methyl ester carboxylesterase
VVFVIPRRFLPALAVPFLAALMGFFGVAWYVSSRIGNEALRAAYDHRPPLCDDAVVVALTDSTITLRPADDDSSRVRRGTTWGLRWRGGWGDVGTLLGASSSGVTRRFRTHLGRPRPGTHVDLSAETAWSNPRQACGLPFQEVRVQTELGPTPAWLVPGASDTWAILVHGKGAERTQALRVLELYAKQGMPCLVLSYRNDQEGVASPDGNYHYGLTEWKDLEAGVQFALAHGAQRVVPVGDSMGGGIILAFLENSVLATRVQGAVLEAPMIDFGATIDLGIRLARMPVIDAPIPKLAGTVGKELASIRYGVDWRSLDLSVDAGRIRAPVLLLHGDADDVVPFESSVALAAHFPDLVTLVRFRGARHLECRSIDPDRYDAAVTKFLEELPGAVLRRRTECP